MEILKIKVPNAEDILSREIVNFIKKLRNADLFKPPGIAESIDWANALVQLDCSSLESDFIDNTLGTLLKYQDDIKKIQGSEAYRILNEVKTELAIKG